MSWFIGANAPAFYYNLPRRFVNGVSSYANGMIQLEDTVGLKTLLQTLQRELDDALPAARVIVRPIEQGPYLPAPIELHFYGPDLEVLRELGRQARIELAQVAGITHTKTSLGGFAPKLALALKEDESQRVGLDNTEVAQQLNTALEGIVGGSILDDREELPIRVRFSDTQRLDGGHGANLSQLTTLSLVPSSTTAQTNPSSITLPLSTIAGLTVVPDQSVITRHNGQRSNTVQGYVASGSLPAQVLSLYKERLETQSFALPPGYTMEWDGESAERNRAIDNLLAITQVLLVLMAAILVLSFNSFRCMVLILLVAVQSIGLSLVSLWIFDYPLGFMAILGTVGLIGVAINDAIVVLTAIRSDPKAVHGDRRAIREIILQSTRHVLTTTLTTLTGFLPLIRNGGELWPPLAICIAAGVGGATLLALFFIPAAYLLLIHQLPQLFGQRNQRHQGQPAPLSVVSHEG